MARARAPEPARPNRTFSSISPRRRKERYKEAAHELNEEKQRIANGQFGSLAPTPAPKASAQVHAKNALTTVINSLDKLVCRSMLKIPAKCAAFFRCELLRLKCPSPQVELERRITGLENDSLYDRMRDTSANPGMATSHAADAVPSILGSNGNPTAKRGARTAPARSGLSFTKKRTNCTLGGPASTSYSVKMVTKKRGLQVPKSGAALAAVRKGSGQRSGASAGRRPQDMQPQSGSRNNMPSGRGAGRMANQDVAISGWLDKSKTKTSSAGGSREAVGQRQYGNKSMHQFSELRGQMDRRKGDIFLPRSPHPTFLFLSISISWPSIALSTRTLLPSRHAEAAPEQQHGATGGPAELASGHRETGGVVHGADQSGDGTTPGLAPSAAGSRVGKGWWWARRAERLVRSWGVRYF